ncbi:MAG: hypothetical protein ABIL58_24285 [Pseudomonadota bacterium]
MKRSGRIIGTDDHTPMSPRDLFWLSVSVGATMLGLGIIWPLVP